MAAIAAKTERKEMLTKENLDALVRWQAAAEVLAAAKETELALRLQVYKNAFQNPVEGTNTCPLLNGWVLKGRRVLSRKIDETQLASVREQLEGAGGSFDELVRFKPELAITAYKALTDAHRNIVDQMVTTTEGTPQLEIMLPKKAGKAVKR